MSGRLTRWLGDVQARVVTALARRTPQRGQAATEYVAVVGVLAFGLFTPFFRLDGERYSVFMMFFEAFEIYINSFHTVITLPIP